MQSVTITQELEEAFLQELSQQGKSKHDIAEYRRTIDGVRRFADSYQDVLTRERMALWREEQIKQGAAQGTVTNRTVRMNRFFRYAGAEQLCFSRGGRRDLTGKRFGSLVALEPCEEKSADRSICWRCRCEACGKEKIIPANQLTKGVHITCGCGRSVRLQESNGYVEGTCLKNIFSDKLNSNNTSGYKGVFQKRGKWTATIQYKKKSYYLGSYDKIEDAIDARRLAEQWVKEDAEKLLREYMEGKRGEIHAEQHTEE